MRVVVASCWAYRDTHRPFLELFKKFWPEQVENLHMISDEIIGDPVIPVVERKGSWCQILASYLESDDDRPVCLLQDDFFLNAPVNQSLIEHALEQMKARNAGMIRLYPCPGADEDYGDPHYGIVKKGSAYRISCQASLWRNDYLHTIASRCGLTPRDFELVGTRIAEDLPDEVLAFKRDSGPWPLNYYCSAISAGRWNPDALEFCRKNGIAVDTSLRPIAEKVAV